MIKKTLLAFIAGLMMTPAYASDIDHRALLQLVNNFLHAGAKPPATEADYYADSGVAYFEQGLFSKSEILKDIAAHDARWPVRSFELASGLDVHWLNDLAKPLVIVNFSVAYELSNGSKHRSGVIPESICLSTTSGQIFAVSNRSFFRR